MPFALVIIGLVMIVSGARDTYRELGSELIEDFTGPGNFTWWIAGIGAVGAVGYYEPLRPASRLFMALILISLLLSNQGFFAKLTGALQKGPETITPPAPMEQGSSKGTVTGTGHPDNRLWNFAANLDVGPGSSIEPPAPPKRPETVGEAIKMGADFARFVLPFFGVPTV